MIWVGAGLVAGLVAAAAEVQRRSRDGMRKRQRFKRQWADAPELPHPSTRPGRACGGGAPADAALGGSSEGADSPWGPGRAARPHAVPAQRSAPPRLQGSGAAQDWGAASPPPRWARRAKAEVRPPRRFPPDGGAGRGAAAPPQKLLPEEPVRAGEGGFQARGPTAGLGRPFPRRRRGARPSPPSRRPVTRKMTRKTCALLSPWAAAAGLDIRDQGWGRRPQLRAGRLPDRPPPWSLSAPGSLASARHGGKRRGRAAGPEDRGPAGRPRAAARCPNTS